MQILSALFFALFSLAMVFSTRPSAAVDCMMYVPSANKLVAVECGEGRNPAPSENAPASKTAPPTTPQPASLPEPTTEGLESGEAKVLETAKALANKWIDAVGAFKADSRLRDRWCETRANFKLYAQEPNKRERQKLWERQVALDAEMGEVGKSVDGLMDEKNAAFVLEYQYKWGKPDIRLKNTQIGVRLTNARNEALKLSCQCLHDARTRKLVCCESCDSDFLKSRYAQRGSSD